MTKQDFQTEPPTSKPQEPGKTESSSLDEPKRLSRNEELRREYKRHYGFKPCGMTTQQLERAIDTATQNAASSQGSSENSLATMEDAMRRKG
jgi:hypothetical protein